MIRATTRAQSARRSPVPALGSRRISNDKSPMHSLTRGFSHGCVVGKIVHCRRANRFPFGSYSPKRRLYGKMMLDASFLSANAWLQQLIDPRLQLMCDA